MRAMCSFSLAIQYLLATLYGAVRVLRTGVLFYSLFLMCVLHVQLTALELYSYHSIR